MPEPILIERDVPIRMRDGTTLRADVYRPSTGTRQPVLLTRTPYGKSQTINGFFFSALERGYSIVVQDVRGQGASEGEGRLFLHEQEDGFDTIAWIAEQPWADGSVGMFGWSYLGYTQWAAAAAQPPALKAIVPAMTFSNPYQSSYQDGVPRLGLSVSWLLLVGALPQIQRMPLSPQEKQKLMAFWAKTVDGMLTGETFRCLPLEDMPLIGKNGIAPYFAEELAHPEPDAFWEAMRIPYEKIRVPTLQIGGWYDVFLRSVLQDYQALVRLDGNVRHRLVIGPWTHGNFEASAGEVNFGVQASGLALQLDELHLNWFDAWVKNDPAKIQGTPPVRIFDMGARGWSPALLWPPEQAQPVRYYLHSAGKANTRAGDGGLSPAAAEAEPADSYDYHPENPVPTRGGSVWGWMGSLAGGAYSQQGVEDRPDVLVYTSPVLEQPLQVNGSVRVELWAATSAEDTHFTAKLVDVYPDGTAINLQDGIVRAAHQQAGLQPGNPNEFQIDLAEILYTFLPGHRLRIEISSSTFPQYARSLNAKQQAGKAPVLETATQRIFHDASHPSAVVLSVLPSGSRPIGSTDQ